MLLISCICECQNTELIMVFHNHYHRVARLKQNCEFKTDITQRVYVYNAQKRSLWVNVFWVKSMHKFYAIINVTPLKTYFLEKYVTIFLILFRLHLLKAVFFLYYLFFFLLLFFLIMKSSMVLENESQFYNLWVPLFTCVAFYIAFCILKGVSQYIAVILDNRKHIHHAGFTFLFFVFLEYVCNSE